MSPDFANSIFECAGTFFVLGSVRKAYRQDSAKGISWTTIAFFAGWGYWNLFYYPNLNQIESFFGALALALANTLYLWILLTRRNK